MSGPWEDYGPARQEPAGPWADYAPQQAKPEPAAGPKKVYSGAILPLSRYEDGSVGFDSDAGLIGTAKRGAQTLFQQSQVPGEVAAGRMAFDSDEAIDAMAGIGTVATPLRGRPQIGNSSALRRGEPAVPTQDELRAAARQGYNTVRDSGVDYDGQFVSGLFGRVQRELEADGLFDVAKGAPGTHSLLRQLQAAPPGSVAGVQQLEAARRALGHIAREVGPNGAPTADAAAAARAQEVLTRFIAEPPAPAVVAGDAAVASRAINDARGNYAARMRSRQLTRADDHAELNAGATHSGTNLDNNLRQQARNILKSEKLSQGFSPEELTALREVAMGTPSRNAMRFVGNLLGGGGGLGMAMTGFAGMAASGAAAGGTTGALIAGGMSPVIGAAARATGSNITRRAFENVDNMTRRRSPLYEQRLQNPPMVEAPLTTQEMLARGLLAGAGGYHPEGR